MTDVWSWPQLYLLGLVIFGLIDSALLFMAWRSWGATLKWHEYLIPVILWPIALLSLPYYYLREYKRVKKDHDNR